MKSLNSASLSFNVLYNCFIWLTRSAFSHVNRFLSALIATQNTQYISTASTQYTVHQDTSTPVQYSNTPSTANTHPVDKNDDCCSIQSFVTGDSLPSRLKNKDVIGGWITDSASGRTGPLTDRSDRSIVTARCDLFRVPENNITRKRGEAHRDGRPIGWVGFATYRMILTC